VVRADKDGRYRLRPMDKHYTLLAVGGAGGCALKQEDVPPGGELKLQRWGGVEGGLRLNAGPLAHTPVASEEERSQPYVAGNPGPIFTLAGGQASTDAAGHFVLDHVPAGESIRLYQLVPMGGGSTRYRTIGTYSTKSGETVTVKAGGHGRPV